jgi:hypothetical protein
MECGICRRRHVADGRAGVRLDDALVQYDRNDVSGASSRGMLQSSALDTHSDKVTRARSQS